ncbi:MAG: MobV family relaxase [Eubacteriales bacterium]|nr:MobV family relaxase [Eubacteriales bacterium]NLX92288.1 plasmid recombination protein [Clostridiales bacterium]
MPYAILRFQKKKSGGVTASYAHNERKKEAYKSNPDIDTSRKEENYHLVLPKQTYLREAKRLIALAGCRTRKDSTVMVETLITASPEFMNTLPPSEQREYFQRALDFLSNKIDRNNIISATIHMDEKTPHMHLVFCPIVDGKNGKSLSAKAILGNQAQLSKWQTEYHKVMSERWPELERGTPSLITKRKHIPQTLFKQAERLDKQIAAVETAINDIGLVGTSKKKEAAVKVLHEWLPRAQYFTAKVNEVSGYIKELEKKEAETQDRINRAEARGEKSADRTIARLQAQMNEIKQMLREERNRSDKLRRQCRNQESLISRIPHEQREKLVAQMKSQKERSREDDGR